VLGQRIARFESWFQGNIGHLGFKKIMAMFESAKLLVIFYSLIVKGHKDGGK